MKKFYGIRNETSEPRAVVSVYGDIESVTAKEFIDELRTLGAERDLEIRVNSYGGDFFAALAVYNLLSAHKGSIECIIDGVAASAASLIAIAGRVLMPQNAWFMVHSLKGSLDGDTLGRLEESMIAAYQKKTGLSRERVRELLDGETWLSAKQALDLKFADEITGPIKIAAQANLSNFKKLPAALRHAGNSGEARIKPAALATRKLINIPPEVRAEAQREVSARAVAIFEACAEAGVAELAFDFFNRSLPVEEVKRALMDAPAIARICTAAGVKSRSAEYIRQGKTADEVRALVSGIFRLTGVNGLPPTAYKPMTTSEVYERRRHRGNMR